VSRDAYDRLWKETWGDLQRLGPVHRHQREALLGTVRSLDVRTVLDVGCGSGENLSALATLPGLVLTGVDVSTEALALAAKRVPQARLVEADVQRRALPERFDLVMSIQVIEHLVDDVAALTHMGDMATRWVLVTSMCGTMRPSEAHIGHLRNYSFEELREKADIAGLEVVDLFGWGFPFYSPLYRTAIELLPGGPPSGVMGRGSQVVARALHALYKLNVPRRGDVVTMLARPRREKRITPLAVAGK
jgi:SAM-dependent methyltransferase